MIPMMIGITFLTAVVMSFLPGGPIEQMTSLNPKVSPEVRERLRQQLHLDKPLPVRYVKWLNDLAHFNLGVSIKDNRPISQKIAEHLPKTILLSGLSLLLAFVLAVPIGLFSAIKHNTLCDRALTVFVFLGFSIPTFWLALLLMIAFGIHLGWFPITGFRSVLADEMSRFGQILDVARHLALPLIVTGLTSLAGLSRYMRNGMLEVIRQDYIRTARAKGLSEKRVIFVHALKNTLIPLVTIVGLSIPGLISSSVILETIFSYPGIGRLTYEAIVSRDLLLVMGTVTMAAFLTLLGNLVADVGYALTDPRIRYR